MAFIDIAKCEYTCLLLGILLILNEIIQNYIVSNFAQMRKLSQTSTKWNNERKQIYIYIS